MNKGVLFLKTAFFTEYLLYKVIFIIVKQLLKFKKPFLSVIDVYF